MNLFGPALPMRTTASDANDDLVGNRFVEPGAPADVALFGLPYDGAVIGRKGARFGPDAVRAELRKLKSAAPERWLDLGNAVMPDDGDPRAAGDIATQAMRAALATGAFPVALGGDHSLTYGLVKALPPGVAVLNIDAHLDVREAATPNSGTSFRRLVDEKVVPAEWITEVGIRPFANSPKYLSWARSHGIHVHEALELPELPAGARGLYVSLDIDVLDESAAPGVSAPTPGGPTTRELFEYLGEVARRYPVLAMDVVETCPPLDIDNRTARAAAWAILNFVSARRA
jgi:formiminoglutamase